MNPGEHYGRYEILRLLGRGAMGEVYLAQDQQTRRRIALKVVYRGPDPEDEEALAAERLGAELQKRLAGVDQRVVVVNGYGKINGDLVIEMEYIEGEDLSTILGRGPLHPDRAAGIAAELCEMLEKLRTFTTTIDGQRFVGVVHGDLKPKNIRIDLQNQVKVIDFGIAKALSHTRKHTLNLFASKAYCSPERLDTHNMDTHSDLWSVGVLLYQMIAGRLPFDEQSGERLERRIKSPHPPDPLPGHCPEPLRDIVFQMLARDPARRYQSATEVRADLQCYVRGEPVQAQPYASDATVRTTTAVYEDAADDGTRKSTVPVSPPVRSNRKRNVRLAAFALAGLAFIAFAQSQFSVLNHADQLKRDLEAGHVTDLDQAWTRYQDLAQRSHLPLLLWSVRRHLKTKLIAAGDEPILEYRSADAPLVYEKQWRQAHAALARAMELDPEDHKVVGKMRLCEGHLERINAKGAGRMKKLNTAAAKFREASELMKDAPDPYLGLARLYVYDLNDMDRAEQALNQARRHGHAMGKRETAQLADGYYRRAHRTVADSHVFIDMPQQEKDYLKKAKEDYRHAQDLYSEIGSFGNAARNLIQVIREMEQVDQRLRVLDGAAPGP